MDKIKDFQDFATRILPILEIQSIRLEDKTSVDGDYEIVSRQDGQDQKIFRILLL